MFIKLLVPYKNHSAGSVIKAESLPSDVVKDLLFSSGAKALGENGYTTRMMTAEKVSKKSKKKKEEVELSAETEPYSE